MGVGAVIRDPVHGQLVARRFERGLPGAADREVVGFRTARLPAVGDLAADVDEAAVAERKTRVGFDGDLVPVAFRIAAEPRDEIEAGIVGFQVEVDHARDGVGAVLRRRTVPQHFHGAQRDAREVADVGAVRTEPAELHERGAVAPPAVDEHERVVRIEPSQTRGPHERGPVGDRLARDVERRHDGVDDVHEVG